MLSISSFFHGLWDNVNKNTVQPEKPKKTIWRMRYACWITKATHTYTLRMCNTYCFSTATMRKRRNVTLYVHCLSCYNRDGVCLVSGTKRNSKIHSGWLLTWGNCWPHFQSRGLAFCHEDGGSKFLQMFSTCPPRHIYTISAVRKSDFTTTIIVFRVKEYQHWLVQ